MRMIVVMLVLTLSGVLRAEPDPVDFGDVEIGAGFASVQAHPNCVCGCYFLDQSGLRLLHAGLGGGAFVSDRFAVVVRMHASTTEFEHGGTASIEAFAGVGAHLQLLRFSRPVDYLFLEVVPGYELLVTGDSGDGAGLAVATRFGVNVSYATVAIGSTLLVDGSARTSQTDVTFVLGLHFGR